MSIYLPSVTVTMMKDPVMGQDVHIVVLKKEQWTFDD